MKTFAFRLEQVLRWREAQVDLQKSRVAAASARLAGIESALELQKAGLASAAAGVPERATGAGLSAYAGFREISRVRIRDLEAQVPVAKRALAAEMDRLIEANRRVRLLEKLKQSGQARWRAEFDRELAAFADEASLSRFTSTKLQSENRRARSSGG